MPLYDYRCENCGDFRAFRPMAESTSAAQCPQCRARSERSLVAPFLAGRGAAAMALPPAGSNAARVPWRRMCGFGCTHANCG